MPTLIMGPPQCFSEFVNYHTAKYAPAYSGSCNCDDVFKAVCVCIYTLVALITFAAYVFTGR